MSAQKVVRYRMHYTGQANFDSPWRAVVHLFNAENEGIGKIFFIDGDNISADEIDIDGTVLMKVPTSQYHNIMDLLRNEGPLSFKYDSGHGKTFLYTGKERVGEGEGGLRASQSRRKS